MADKNWLMEQLKGLIQLNKDTCELIDTSRNSLLPDIDIWILDAKKQIERNNWLISVIKKQLLRDYQLDLDENELKMLNSI